VPLSLPQRDSEMAADSNLAHFKAGVPGKAKKRIHESPCRKRLDPKRTDAGACSSTCEQCLSPKEGRETVVEWSLLMNAITTISRRPRALLPPQRIESRARVLEFSHLHPRWLHKCPHVLAGGKFPAPPAPPLAIQFE
jgi:hypothetical protein